MADKRFDVLGLGCVTIDDLLYVADYPPVETKMRVLRSIRQCGGLTATGLVAAARFGAHCAFAGVLGPDQSSQFVRTCLCDEGIDLEHHVALPEARPIHSTIIVSEQQHSRTIFFAVPGPVGAHPQLPATEVILAARVLYVDHYGIEGMTRAARLARSAGIPVVGDLERDEFPGFHELLALVDHVIVSRSFAARLLGFDDPPHALDRLWTDQRSVVVVTCGADGCWYRDASETTLHYPAFTVEVTDTTGCGDVFHGVYAAALAQSLPLVERIRLATAAAALKAMRSGGQAGIPTRAEVDAFLTSSG